MKILILSQVFWPDTASTAQHLADLAAELVRDGHRVDVFCSRYSYEDSSIVYAKREINMGVNIYRIRNTHFGKKNVFSRVLDFFSFNLLLFFRLTRLKAKEYDRVLGMTSPPMVSFIGVLFGKWKKINFSYWAMDLQPELSIASGLLKKNSLAAVLFSRMGDYVIKRSNNIVALDSYMAKHLVSRGAKLESLKILPVWSVVENEFSGIRADNPFRIEHGFEDKIVVMYSGNHAYVHPLRTLLQAILLLKDDDRFLFVFVGEGVRKDEVTEFKKRNQLNSIIQLPYEPRNNIHISLSSADLQVVILGEGQVGYTHPNKIYSAMLLGKPIVFVGPEPSHVMDILNCLPGNIAVQHGQYEKLALKLKDFANQSEAVRRSIGYKNMEFAKTHFDPTVLRTKMVEAILTD
jgi:colanic acid biosynthesis glycosyl transferase WcaI